MSVIYQRATCWSDIKKAVGYDETDDSLVGYVKRQAFFDALRAEAIKRNILWPQIGVNLAQLEPLLQFWHPALKDAPQMKYVIVHKDTLEGYRTLGDAVGDFAHQTHLHGVGKIFEVREAEQMAAVAAPKPKRVIKLRKSSK